MDRSSVVSVLLLAQFTIYTTTDADAADLSSKVNEHEPSTQLAPAPEPDMPEVGTTWHWRDGASGDEQYTVTLIDINDNEYTFEDSDGCSWVTSGYGPMNIMPALKWQDCSGSTGFHRIRKKKGNLWPMEVDNSVSYKAMGHTGDRWDANRECEVIDQVRVRVEAGEFDTYKVMCETTWNDRMHYYSPDLETTVRVLKAPTTSNSSGEKWDLRLVEIERP